MREKKDARSKFSNGFCQWLKITNCQKQVVKLNEKYEKPEQGPGNTANDL